MKAEAVKPSRRPTAHEGDHNCEAARALDAISWAGLLYERTSSPSPLRDHGIRGMKEDSSKREALVAIGKTALLCQDLPGSRFSNETAEKVASAVVDAFASITPPHLQRRIRVVNLSKGGTDAGSTTKPGNIRLNWKKLVVEGSSSVIMAVGALKVPWLVVLAALVIWNRIWTALTIDLTERHAAVLYVMWSRRDKEKRVRVEGLLGFVNAELQNYSRPPMSEKELSRILEALERLRCIEMVEGDWSLRESIRVKCQ